jgi:chromosome segregation ATPase
MKDLIYLLRLGFQSPSHANKKCIEAADALESLTAERDDLGDDLAQARRYIETLTTERNAYQIAADKMAMEHKVERDALGMKIDALAESDKRLREEVGNLKEGLDGWHARYLDVQTDHDLAISRLAQMTRARDALGTGAARMQDALIWIATVNAMDYEYQAKAEAAIAKEH